MRHSVLLPLAVHVPRVARAYGIPLRIPRDDAAALTFDDGPHPEGTPAVLDALDAAGAKATFFLVGEQVERRPALVAEIVAAGHAIGIHGQRHRNLLRVGPRATADDLRHAHDRIADASGQAPLLYRPPYGVLSAAALATARRAGWETVLWARWGRDWRARATAASIAAEATEGLRGGEIVLLHDADYYSTAGSWRATVEALPRILAAIGEAGLRTVTLR